MTTTDFRAAIRSRLDSLGITPHHAARLAGLSDQTARDYLAGTTDLSTDRALRLAAAVGLRIDLHPIRDFSPPPPGTGGRKPREIAGKTGRKKIPGKSGI